VNAQESALLVIDMQRVFLEESDWQVPAAAALAPGIEALMASYASRTVALRFVPGPETEGPWARYYNLDWPRIPRHPDDPAWNLAISVPRGTPVLTKTGYSAFGAPGLLSLLHGWAARHLILTGVETDVCVLATALAALELNYFVTVVADLVASGDASGHHRALDIMRRLGPHIRVATSGDLETPSAGRTS
jgi:nicotinamidase-related amidase